MGLRFRVGFRVYGLELRLLVGSGVSSSMGDTGASSGVKSIANEDVFIGSLMP